METKVGFFKSSDNNSTSRYKKMGKGTELTKIICNLHMKVLGQLTNEVDIDLKKPSSSTCNPNSHKKTHKNQNQHHNNRYEMSIVKIPKIVKVHNINNSDDMMEAPLDLKVRIEPDRVDNITKFEPDKLKTTKNNDNYYNDIVQESKPKSNECEVCQKQFSSCYSLQRHMRGVHNREKPHVCIVCKKSFTQQSHLKKHFLTHIEEIVVTPLIFPPPGEEDSDSIKSPSSNDSKMIQDTLDAQTQQQNQHYFECKNCHKSFNLINNFKFHRRMCHLERNKNIMGSHQVNRQHTSNKKRKKLRLHQTFFMCRRLQSIRRLCYKNIRKSKEFECQVRGCFSNCSNYKMYMEHICTHSTKFRLSKSKYKTRTNIKTKNEKRKRKSSSSSPTSNMLSTIATTEEVEEVNNDISNYTTLPLPLTMDIPEPEDFLPLSGFGGLLDYVEQVQNLVPLGFPFINSVPPSASIEVVPQVLIPQTETPEIFPLMDLDKGPSCFECEHCHKIFNRKFSYDRHLLIHLGHRPFSCQICGYSFSQQSHLNKHSKKHIEEKHENENAATLNQNATTTTTTTNATTTPTNKAAAITTNDTTTINSKVQSPVAVNNIKTKITTPILKIPIRIPKIDESSKILQPNENINGNSNGVRRSSRRRN